MFESIVEKVIIGESDENGNANPYKLTFVYKTGYSNTVQSKMHKQVKKRKMIMEICLPIPHPTHVECVVLMQNVKNK